MKQLRKKFTDYQIKELITRYLKKKIAKKYIQNQFTLLPLCNVVGTLPC